MSAIGETLRRERLERKLGLDQISRELKISSKFLEAIEQDQFDKLPGGVFAKSFVRQYARLLGLDEEDLAAEVQRVIEPPQTVPQFTEQTKLPPVDIRVPRVEAWQAGGERSFSWSSPLPSLALVVVVMLVCSGVYAWWQRQRNAAAIHQDVATYQPAPVQPPVQTAQVPPPQQTPAPPPAVQPEAAPATVPPPVAEPQQPAAVKPVPAPPADQPPVDNPKPNAPAPRPASANAPVRVEVTADQTVWVLARADDKFAFSGTLEANQTRTVEANDKVLLRLGNAGGVSITLNGKSIGAVGPKGQVRTVQFTSGGFQIVAVPKPSLPLDDIF